MSAVAIFSDLFFIICICRIVSASLRELSASSAHTIVHTFGLYEKEWKQWYDPIGPHRKSHTLTKMLVTSWKDFYDSKKLNQQLSIKGDPDNLFFAQLPNDIVSPHTATLEKLVEYNLARVYRHYVTQRSKAYMSPYCYQGTTNPFLRNKIVQIYHNAFEPVEIPCYTCDYRMTQDGRPKMWFSVVNRPSYDSYEGLILRSNSTAAHLSPKIANRGTEWQVDQTTGENIMNRPGGGLFMNPDRSDNQESSEWSQSGMFFCASVDPEKEGRFTYPDDFVENSVLINVDVILGPEMRFLGKYYSMPQLYDPSKVVACTTTGAEINIECFLSWQAWSCPKVCENAESSKQVTRSRMGYLSFKKRNVLNPIGIDCYKIHGIKGRYFPFCLGVEVIFSVHPYDTQGIPVYSSFWKGRRDHLHNLLLEHFNVPSQTEYFDVKLVNCGEMVECENDPGYREEVRLLNLEDFKQSTLFQRG